jgi:hypothetical protein
MTGHAKNVILYVPVSTSGVSNPVNPEILRIPIQTERRASTIKKIKKNHSSDGKIFSIVTK